MQQNSFEISGHSWIVYHIQTHFSIRTETFVAKLLMFRLSGHHSLALTNTTYLIFVHTACTSTTNAHKHARPPEISADDGFMFCTLKRLVLYIFLHIPARLFVSFSPTVSMKKEHQHLCSHTATHDALCHMVPCNFCDLQYEQISH